MIKANELRTGNLVEQGYIGTIQYQDGYLGCYVNKSKFDSSAGEWYKIDQLKPIHLTEKWLIKFGFEYNKELKLWTNKDFAIRLQSHYHPVYKFLCPLNLPHKYYNIPMKLKFVHELQNTWKILMSFSEELTIK